MSLNGKKFKLPSRTQQQFKDQVNIVTIMKRFNQTHLLPQVSGAMYGDFTGVQDYQSCCQRIIDAEIAFNKLPAAVRERFGNNPGELIEFVRDEKNRPEAEKIGLIQKLPVTPPAAPVRGKTDQGVSPEPPVAGDESDEVPRAKKATKSR